MKIKKYLLFALAVGMLTACDPNKEEGDFDVTNLTSEQLLEGATFTQYSGVKNEDGTITYTPSETGNYIEFNIPAVSSVDVYYLKADGSEQSLSTGKSGGIINYVPTRGSNPQQTLYFRYINQNGEEVTASKEFTLDVSADLTTEMKLICSNSGSKIWTWDPDDQGRVWGNAGADGNDEWNTAIWWGCGLVGDDAAANNNFLTPDPTANNKTQIDKISTTGDSKEVTLGAYMVFNEDGSIKKYSKDGEELASGTFEITNYTGVQSNKVAGNIKITNGALLFPFWCDDKNPKMVEDFNISILSSDKLVITYTEADAGSWGTVTWWRFCSVSDYEGMLTDNGSKQWTWNPDDQGRVWGNAGADGNDEWDTAVWWGCGLVGDDAAAANNFLTPDPTADNKTQIDKISTTGDSKEVTLGAYMVFNNDGTISKYSADGEELASGGWEVSNYTGVQSNKVAGNIKITNGALLFPFWCDDKNPKMVENFNISSLTSSEMVITYTEADAGSWGTVTWWRFKKK